MDRRGFSAQPLTGFQRQRDEAWQVRAWGLAALGCVAGLSIHLLTRASAPAVGNDTIAMHWAIATFLCVSSISLGYVIERGRVYSSLAFAGATGLIMASATYLNGPFRGESFSEPWRIVCAALSVFIAAPLFQAWRENRYNAGFSYGTAYNQAWGNLVLWCASWLFTGIVWMLALLLAELFDLIGINLLSKLIGTDWVAAIMTGTAFGAATGILRDRAAILDHIQRIATTSLSVLAPVLAIGLMLFLAALPFTGLSPLWEATRATTPILLWCIIGALCLSNAVIGANLETESRHSVLRTSALALGLAMLPLGIIAAVSTATRINQHGLTPDRLWAVVFTGIACAYGIAYLGAIAYKRMQAAPLIRSVNLRLTAGLCALALILSTPLVNFGAFSARHQVARLASGAVSSEAFDWQSLRFEFGQAGIAALEKLAETGSTPAIRDAARHALAQTTRWVVHAPAAPAVKDTDLVILPKGTSLPPELRKQLSSYNACGMSKPCVVLHETESSDAVIVTPHTVSVWRRTDQGWRYIDPYAQAGSAQDQGAALKAGQVEVRSRTLRQVYVGGQPVGEPFE